MNERINKFLLAGNKFMPEMYLRQPGFTYSACGPFTKNKEKIQKFIQTGDKRYIYQNNLDKTCFQYDMAYGSYKDSVKRTESDMAYGSYKDSAKRTESGKVLGNKAFKFTSNPTYDGYEKVLAAIVYKFFDKKSAAIRANKFAGSSAKYIPSQQLADELHKPIIKKFKRGKVYSFFKDNIWGADFADMQLIRKCTKGFILLLGVIGCLLKRQEGWHYCQCISKYSK